MDRGAWWAMVHRVTKSQTRLSNWACMHTPRTIPGGSLSGSSEGLWQRGKGGARTYKSFYWKKKCNQSIAAAAKSLQLCPTLCDPHRRQPTKLPHPWDSPGKNTGMGCHLLLQRMEVKSLSRVRLLGTPWTASLPGCSIHGSLQARVLEWGASAFSDIYSYNCYITLYIYIYMYMHTHRYTYISSLSAERAWEQWYPRSI